MVAQQPASRPACILRPLGGIVLFTKTNTVHGRGRTSSPDSFSPQDEL